MVGQPLKGQYGKLILNATLAPRHLALVEPLDRAIEVGAAIGKDFHADRQPPAIGRDLEAADVERQLRRLPRGTARRRHHVYLLAARLRAEEVQPLAVGRERRRVDVPADRAEALGRGQVAGAEIADPERGGSLAQVLAAAAKLVKPGGRLVYATCSLLREENEAVAEAFTAEHAGMREFTLLPVAELLSKAKLAQAQALSQDLAVSDAAAQKIGGGAQYPYLRLWPHLHGTDGFFAAVWQRRL